MKHCVRTFILIISIISSLHGEDAEKYGFLNVVNMIPSANPCEILLATKNLVPKGLKQGAETGWFMVPVGRHPVVVSHSTYVKHLTTINVVDGKSHVIVIFPKENEQNQTGSEPQSAEIRIASLPAYESTGFALKAVSTLLGKNLFQLAKKSIELEFLKEADVPNWTGGGFVIQFDGNQIGSVSRGRDRCSSYLVISTDHAGNFLTAMVNADIQKLPPWMKNEEEKPQ